MHGRLNGALFAVGLLTASASAAGDLAYTSTVGAGETAIIDTRPLAECRRATLSGARCLPAADLLGERRQLPGERDLLWLLGTLGLDGEESVLVVGDTAGSRDFVAGVLYLAGQRQVRILGDAITPRLGALAVSPGQGRGMLRTAVFTRPMREHLWLVHERDLKTPNGAPIPVGDAYASIIRLARQAASGGRIEPVGWNWPTTGGGQ